MRDSVVIYKSFHEASKMLQPDEYKELWTALFEYAMNDEKPEFESTLAEVIFTMAQPQIDANKKRHDDGCKGGRPKKPLVIDTENHRLQNPKPNENENENVNENVNVNEKIKEEAPKAPRPKKEKPEKHLHGEYKHVRLTDAEFERLAADFGEETRAAAIKRLDEYIQEKPTYKSQDHNLAIRRWVIKALEEDKAKTKPQGKAPATVFHNFDCRHEYNFEDMEQKLLGG